MWKLFVISCVLLHGVIAGIVDVSLEATWAKTPFKLHVLEAFSNYNESLYQPLVEKLLDISRDGDDLVFDEDSLGVSDEAYYEFAQDLVPNLDDLAIIGIEIANKFNSPLIQSHYNHYVNDVKDKHTCGDDLVLFEGNSETAYCETDAAFVLKTVEIQLAIKDVRLPIDHILGNYYSKRIYTIYGDFQDPKFKLMFFNMYQLVVQDKLTLLWRYVPQKNTDFEVLPAYGVELNVKRTDYIAIDDRGLDQSKLVFDHGDLDFTLDESKDLTDQDIPHIKPARFVEFVNYQFTNYILTAKNQLKTLVDTLSEFPKYAFHIGAQNYDFEILANIEQESNKLKTPVGMYVNGAFITDSKIDLFELLSTVKRELSFINIFKKLGVSISTAKDLMSKFSEDILVAYNSPNKRYNISRFKKIIGYINNIESDSRYADFLPSREVYKKAPPQGQLPLAKENIFDMVFVLDFTNKLQLQYLIECLNRVLESKYPIRIGVIPLKNASEYSEKATSKFYGAMKYQGPEEALKFLNMFNMLINGKEGLNLMTFSAMAAPEIEEEDKKMIYLWLDQFYKDFSINQNEPMIIADGVMFPYNEINAAMGQIYTDLTELLNDYNTKVIPEKMKFGKYIRRNAIGIKNSNVIPQTLGGFRSTYTELPEQNLYSYAKTLNILSFDFNMDELKSKTPVTLNLIGSLESNTFIDELQQLTKFIKHYKDPIRVRIAETSGSDKFQELTGLDFTNLVDSIATLSIEKKINDTLAIPIKTFVNSMFRFTQSTKEEMVLVIAGRHIPIRQVLLARELDALVKFEVNSRLSPINNLIKDIEFDIDIDDHIDRLDYISWSISNTYFYEQPEYYLSEAIPRLPIKDLPHKLRVDSVFNTEEAKLDINLIIDPVSELAQKFTSFIPLLESLDFVNLFVYLKPDTTTKVEELPIKRFYKALYLPKVDLNEDYHIKFNHVPERTLFNIGIDDPQRWLVNIKEANIDLDNIKLDLNSNGDDVKAVFQLKNILVEGYAFYELQPGLKIAPAAVGLELVNNDESSVADTNVMANYGYFQLNANPGSFDLQVKKGSKGDEIFKLVTNDKVWVTRLDGLIMRPQFVKQEGKESVELIRSVNSESEEAGLFSKFGSFINSLLAPPGGKQADVNIFTIASGHLYERFMKIMITSVMKNTGSTVKFWLIENYMSPELKEQLPKLSKHYGFEYELLMYKWPLWLQNQRERQRTIWGYKILFLDVLFPQNLSKVIFVDADQVVRTDMINLVNEDLNDAPYGYTPMCESREGMDGFRFWKTGFWQEALGDKYKYHISALYVVDLNRFREIAAGDLLRQQYRILSRDPESLSNLDQDLPNSLQHFLPIHSLDQSWLWCETWCDDKSLVEAKTIDLCNNPLTKESKLERAKRQIPEWESLDTEITTIIEGTFKKERYRDEL